MYAKDAYIVTISRLFCAERHAPHKKGSLFQPDSVIKKQPPNGRLLFYYRGFQRAVCDRPQAMVVAKYRIISISIEDFI